MRTKEQVLCELNNVKDKIVCLEKELKDMEIKHGDYGYWNKPSLGKSDPVIWLDDNGCLTLFNQTKRCQYHTVENSRQYFTKEGNIFYELKKG